MTECDILIIGGGPAGYSAAFAAARRGLRVALCDREAPGGTCLHRGCIPTKALVGVARRWREARGGAAFGLPVPQGEPDFAAVMAAGRKSIGILAQGLARQLQSARVTVLCGEARLTGPRTAAVTTTAGVEVVTAARGVILAPGSRPALIPGLAPDGERVVDSDLLWRRDRLPRKLLVVGGGVVGAEFASAFCGLGAQVTVVEMAAKPLAGLDDDIAAGLLRCFKKDGIAVLPGTTVRELACLTSGVSARLATAAGETSWSGDAVIVATGRVPATAALGGEEFGLLRTAAGALAVDGFLATPVPGIYAAGDAAGGVQLAHVAAEQGELAVDNLLGAQRAFNAARVPWALFTEPEAGGVGLSEQQALAAGLALAIGKVPVRALGRAQATGEIEGLCKVIARKDNGQVVGVHLLGARATDLLAVGVVALHAGLTVGQLAAMTQAHPTFAEGLQDAARAALQACRNGEGLSC